MAIIRLIIRPRDTDHPEAGFRATLDAKDFHMDEIEASLPKMPQSLQNALADWKAAYSTQEGVRSHYRISGIVIDHPIQDVIGLSESLRKQLNLWLAFPDEHWREIREELIRLSSRINEPRLLIDLGQNDLLKRLPWQDWNLLVQNYPEVDAALRAFSPGHLGTQLVYPQAAKIRILVVVGDSTGIRTEQDLEAIKTWEREYPTKVEIIELLQPTTKELQTALDDAQGYHIFVYVGHSRSSDDGQVGWLSLNATDELSILNFRLALRRVVERGLQLAIFNSCDGLGLAQQLAQLNLPRCIVMREPVPDMVAVEFIDRFFRQFIKEQQPLMRSVRIARQGLEHFNTQFSEVTWLPIVCAKQNMPPLTWQDLLDHLSPELEPPLPPEPEPLLPLEPPPRGSKHLKKVAAGIGALALTAALVSEPSIRNRLFSLFNPASPVTIQALQPAAQLISAGGEPIESSIIALSGNYAELKQQGMDDFKAGNYPTARDKFAQIRDEAEKQWRQSKDPEARKALQDPTVLIYKNNAEVRLRHQNGEPIYTIAAAVPLNINIGQQMLFGIAQAQDRAVNPASSDPVNLEIIVANDRNDPNQAQAIAESLAKTKFEGRQILAVVGHYTSNSTCDALKTGYAPAQIPVVSPLSTAADLRQDCGNSNLFFRTTSSTKIEAETLVNYLINLKPRPKVAVFYNKEDQFSLNLYNQLQSALLAKGGIVLQAFDLSTAIDPEATLKQVSNVDALAVLPDGRTGSPDAFNRAVEVLKANRGEKLMLGSNPLYDDAVVNKGGGAETLKNKLLIATDWYRQCVPTGAGSFVKEAEETYWFGGVNRSTALSYEAIQALQATLKPNVTSAEIQQSLSMLQGVKSNVFPNKTISFDANGDREELTTRVLTTPTGNPNNPFGLMPGTSCR